MGHRCLLRLKVARCLEKYRKIPIISPGFIEVRKHFSWARIRGGLIFGGSFGLTGDLCMPKYFPFSVQSERLITKFNALNFTKEQQVNTETIYALSMFIILTIHTQSQM